MADEFVQERRIMATPVRIGSAADRGRPSIEMDSEELSAKIASRANDPLKYFRQNSVKGKLSEQMRYGVEFSDQMDEAVSSALKAFIYAQLAEA